MTRPAQRPLCLITGASSGLGAAFAHEFAGQGWDLVLTARRAERLEALAAALHERRGAQCHVVPADLADAEGPAALIAATEALGRPLEGLVNNAGYGMATGFGDTDWATQARFLQVMVTAPAQLAHWAFNGMLARGRGRILNVASVAALAPALAGNTLYPGAKSLLVKLSESLAAEAGRAGADIRVTALCPGLTKTEFFEASGMRPNLDPSAPEALWQSAETVARIGYRALEQGRVVEVAGPVNKGLSFAIRMLPPAAVRRLAARRRFYATDADET